MTGETQAPAAAERSASLDLSRTAVRPLAAPAPLAASFGETPGDASGGLTGLTNPASLNGLLAPALAASLENLKTSLDAVRWPDAASDAANGTGSAGRPLAESACGLSAYGLSISGLFVSGGAAAGQSLPTGGFDLDAQTTLAPGAYTLDYLAASQASAGGGDATRVVIHVNSGDTWRDVLQRLSRALGSAGPGALSRLVPVPAASAIAAPPPKAAPLGEGSARELAGALADVLAAASEVGAALGHSAHSAHSGGHSAHSDGHSAGAPSGVSRSGEAQSEEWPGIPVELAAALSRAGVRGAATAADGGETQAGGRALWLSGETFLTALYAEPDATRAVIAGPDGLLPLLARRTEELVGKLAERVADSVVAGGASPGSAGAEASGALAVPLTEAEAERGGRRLLDTSDAAASFLLDEQAVGGAGALLRRNG